MRVTITGHKGMLGHDLQAALAPEYELQLLDQPECDITDAEAVRRFLTGAKPAAIVHGAAYTDVDGCERNPELAMRVNGQGTCHIAQAAAAIGARLIYISTDYVFDGQKGEPYLETDPVSPRSAYGRSKLAGEESVRQCPGSLIVRTAWLYGKYGKHFPGAILGRANQGEPLRVVNDQQGSPTWSRDLSNAIAALLRTDVKGIVHATGAGSCTWFDFARAILDEAGKSEVPVTPISTSELDRLAPRPAYSVLSHGRLNQLGIFMPPWRDSLLEFLALELGMRR